MAQSDVYSNKDSNQNRKLEQNQSFHFRMFSWTAAILLGVGFVFYYYTEMERPPVYVGPAARAVTTQSHYYHNPNFNGKSDDSHRYNSNKAPYEQ